MPLSYLWWRNLKFPENGSQKLVGFSLFVFRYSKFQTFMNIKKRLKLFCFSIFIIQKSRTFLNIKKGWSCLAFWFSLFKTVKLLRISKTGWSCFVFWFSRFKFIKHNQIIKKAVQTFRLWGPFRMNIKILIFNFLRNVFLTFANIKKTSNSVLKRSKMVRNRSQWCLMGNSNWIDPFSVENPKWDFGNLGIWDSKKNVQNCRV